LGVLVQHGRQSQPSAKLKFIRAGVGRKRAKTRSQKARCHNGPVIESAKLELLSFVSAFEMTYYDEERKPREASASPATVEKQLNNMADKCRDVAKYLGKMHRDAIHEWSRAAGVVGPISIWQLSEILDESASSAEQALEAFKGDRRAGATRGNPGDAMAAAMTVTAAFVYSRLTAKRISQGTKSGSFEALLERILRDRGQPAALHSIQETPFPSIVRARDPAKC
jgi:hypothetical protein